ncbi:hypothetical protein Halru_2587 [Halovivax ruber XH-70]|uniref:HTH iclR-type domain-containing protein n=1 Tax=Halovivax ruber (strain DSM 18193 / JCM 13892 / XH-70) TaxID=797302 RepID=L0IEA1_HALRX|nr:hypothetical protein [Halovivax ruber]AGB17168.1 hypothetical protein Halru_2587 [Halovivax ruber XH-70]
MRVRSALLVSLVVALLLTAGPTPVAALDDGTGDDRRQDIRVELLENGDASWTVEHHIVLRNESDRERFDAFAEDIKSGDRDVKLDRSWFEGFVPHAEAGTGRQMAIEDAGWEEPTVRSASEVGAYEAGEVGPDTQIGTLRYSVTWTNFAETDGDYLRLQETFMTASGDTWLSGLEPHQRLIIEAPDEHDIVTAPQGIENNRIVWNGQTTLGPGDFEIVFASQTGVVGFVQDSWPLLLGLLSLVAVGGGALWYVRTTRDGEWDEDDRPDWWPSIAPVATRLRHLITDADPGDDTDDRDSIDEPSPEPTESAVADEDHDAVDPELLSDEERVMHLLTANGGRMKQAAIVDETGWSNAKVSQLLSQMDEDDDIEKLRIGRENLITLPDVDPTQVE